MLEQLVPELKQQRFESPFANDMFEAADDWRNLGDLLLENSPKTNFQGRAFQERELLQALQEFASRRSLDDQRRCVPLFEVGERLIRIAEAREYPKQGYLDFLNVTRQQFGFLQPEYGFRVVNENATSIRFSSGHVYVQLECLGFIGDTCMFGPEPGSDVHFWLSDLLFLHGDQRYLDFREDTRLVETKAAVEHWFTCAATILKQLGKDVVANVPGVFERLQEAQDRRDQEYTEEMNRLYLPKA